MSEWRHIALTEIARVVLAASDARTLKTGHKEHSKGAVFREPGHVPMPRRVRRGGLTVGIAQDGGLQHLQFYAFVVLDHVDETAG